MSVDEWKDGDGWRKLSVLRLPLRRFVEVAIGEEDKLIDGMRLQVELLRQAS